MSTLTPGTYNARGVSAQLGTTNDGKEQVAVDLVFTDGEFAGRHITWFGYFSEKTIDRTFESLRYLGWEGDDLADLRGVDRNDVSIVLEEEVYEGKSRIKVRWINRGGGLALKQPMTADQARVFAARMKARAAAHRAAMGVPPRNDAPMPKDDDIPFAWLLIGATSLAHLLFAAPWT